MFFKTQLNDSTWVLLEAEASQAFTKSALEGGDMSPETAFLNVAKVSAQIASAVAASLRPVIKANPGFEVEMSFALKSDGGGNVMIATQPTNGQFHLNLRLG